MARNNQSSSPATTTKKKRWYSYIGEAYRIAKRSYPALGWYLTATFLLSLTLFAVLGITTGRYIIWSVVGVMTAITLTLFVLTQFVRRASYAQIEGKPGAVGAVLGQIRRGWIVSQEPVRFNPRSQDLVFRAIGRPGVVLITEGPANRVQRLAAEERNSIKRIAPSAPVHIIQVGSEEGQVRIIDLQKALRKLPKQVSHREVAALASRFTAVRNNNIPIPKGIDPTKARASRRAMRG